MLENLDATAINDAIKGVKGWTLLDEYKIKKEFKFNDFAEAFSFMTACAKYAEDINHHPEWQNSYNKVSVILTTHDIGGLSALDFDMASFMDEASKT